MTSRSKAPARADGAFVWVWLPGATVPVVAGRIGRDGDSYRFAYGSSYLARSEAISLFAPELPLQQGWLAAPEGQDMAGCLWDASPDSWGQRVIIARLTGLMGAAADAVTVDKLTFLLESGSNRIGALDFQRSATEYAPRAQTASIDELHEAARALQAGELREELARALVDGTTVGGARPKVLVADADGEYIAKLGTSADPYPVVKAEAVGLELARRVGLDVPDFRITRSLGRDVLLVKRFDCSSGSCSTLRSATPTTTRATTRPSGTAGTSHSHRPTTCAPSYGAAPRPTRRWTSAAPGGAAAPSRRASLPPRTTG